MEFVSAVLEDGREIDLLTAVIKLTPMFQHLIPTPTVLWEFSMIVSPIRVEI